MIIEQVEYRLKFLNLKITTINKLYIGFRSGEIITLSFRFCVAIKTTFASQEAVKQANY